MRLGHGAALLLAAAGLGAAPAGGAGVKAWIQAEPAGRGQAFTAFVSADQPFSGRYELVAERSGPAGRSSNRQGGSIQAGAGQSVQLSRTSLSPLGEADRYSVVLNVYQGDQLVARDERGR